MKVIDELIAYFQDQAEYIFDREMLESSLFFNTACAIGLKNIRIKRTTNNGDKYIIPSLYFMIQSPAGSGKNFSRDLSRELFKDQFDKFIGRTEEFILSRTDDDGKIDKRYVKLNDYYIPISSSVEGIQKGAQTVNDSGFGSINVVSDELGSTILAMEPIFTKLKTAWDTGISEGQLNVGEGGANYFTCKNVHYNALLFGSPAPFELDAKKKDKLLEAYVSGMARRSFIYHNNVYRKSERRNLNFETMSQEQIQVVLDYKNELRSHINSTEVIIFPNEIRKKLIEYDIQKETVRENSNSLIAEDLGSTKKIEKLLGVICMLDLCDTINENHLKYAIDFTERTDATAEATVEIKPIYIQIYNELEKRAFTARTDIIKAVRDVSLKSLADEMTLVEEHANMVGNSIVKKENSGIIRYKLEKLSSTSLDTISLSKNDNMSAGEPQGFKKIQGKFTNLHKIINSATRYSAGTFLNEYIIDKNYLSDQNLFIIDVDDGMTIDEAKSLFKSMTYLITTTRSHQKDKHGLVCDRFRLIFPTISKFHLEYTVYKQMYENVLEALGMEEADAKCKNSSRWYYGNPDGEHWYNEGELLDIRPFIPNSSEQEQTNNGLTNYSKLVVPEDMDIAERRKHGMMKWILARATKGARDEMLFAYAMFIKDLGLDIEHNVTEINSLFQEPLTDREVIKIIRSASSR